MIRLREIKLPVAHSAQDMKNAIYKRLSLGSILKGRDAKYDITIIKRSLDARKKPELKFVYEVGITFANDADESIIRKRIRPDSRISYDELPVYRLPVIETPVINENVKRPVIVGAGPAGLFCAYILAMAGMQPVVLERGKCVAERCADVEKFWNGGEPDPDSNVQFGEGGAGTFSDGKLNTMVKDQSGRIAFVLNTFVKFGAPKDIIYSAKPHIGTDILQHVIPGMRRAIIDMGGEFRFSARLDGIVARDGEIKQVIVSENEEKLDVDDVVLAVGHSARDTFIMLKEAGVKMSPKPFAIGFRMQHPQSMINMSQYGAYEVEGLGAADYKVTNYKNNSGDPYDSRPKRSVYSFCMCPGGYVVNASSEPGRLAVNGMSYRDRNSQNANSAIVVGVFPEDYGDTNDPLCGMYFQRKLEERAHELGDGMIPVQTYGDYKKKIPTGEYGEVLPCTKGKCRPSDLSTLLPENMAADLIDAIEGFGRSINGFDRDDALLYGIESRTSSPVRIERDETTFMSNISGLYPCGEGAGYAGGITSAAVDGIKVAEAIINKRKEAILWQK